MSSTPQTWWQLAQDINVVKRSAKTALIVGTLLALINHGDALITLNMPLERILKMGLTYIVPYLVATNASIGAIRQQQKSH